MSVLESKMTTAFKWGAQAAEALVNNNRWEEDEDEILDDLTDDQSGPDPANDENF